MGLVKGNATALPLDNESVHCVVTSPPYNVGVEYVGHDDNMPWEAYHEMTLRSALEMRRVLVPGGRAWVNVMPSIPVKDAKGKPTGSRINLGRMWQESLHRAGLQYRDTIVWEQDNFDGGTAWGSWLRPSAPNIRGAYELVICTFKPPYARPTPERWKGVDMPREELGGDWTDLCRNVWKIAPARANADTPAPFPVELPARAIRLSTWPEEIVLDPFAGSGTTLRAAEILGRASIGIDKGAS